MKTFHWKELFLVCSLLLPLAVMGKGEEKMPAPAIQEYDINIPYKDEASGIIFPGKIGDFVKRYVRLNAESSIGNTIHYAANGGISADIYLYWPGQKKGEDLSAFLLRNYNSAKTLIFTMEKEKKREDMPEKEEPFFREENFSCPVPFKSASFTFTAGEETYSSFLFMTVIKREKRLHLVKIRFSCPSELGNEGKKKWEIFRREIIQLLAPAKKAK